MVDHYWRVAGNTKTGDYTIHILLPSGKHNETIGPFYQRDFFEQLEGIRIRQETNGDKYRVKVDGSLLDGEDRHFTDIGELIEVLRQGVKVES